MSKDYADYVEKCDLEAVDAVSPKEFCVVEPRRDDDGNIIYATEQSHKDACDVNKIIEKYDRTGILTHVTKFEGKFGDLTKIDFKEMSDKVAGAHSMFMNLPANIRNRFENDPGELLGFMEDPNNREEAIELGLVHPSWTEETDGLGEHVKEGEQEKEGE